ncbi:MAG: CocE/NonD family hydrolase [Actinomycetes bacterium]
MTLLGNPFRPARPAGRSVHVVAAVVLSLALAGAACSTTDAGPTSSTAAASRGTAPFTAFGSIGQASVVDAGLGTKVTLVSPSGKRLASGTTDRLGSFVFRQVPAGPGYTVESGSGDDLVRTAAFEVLSKDDTPPQSLYDDQTLEPGLNYVRMRDGVELAVTVRLPPGATLADGPFPTVIEYSGYEVAPPGDLLASLARTLTDPGAEPDPLAPSGSTAVGSVISPVLGFAVASVQIRGSGCSGGDFDLFGLPTIYDGYDAVETVAAQDWVKGGKVGMVGISYSGYSQLYVGGTRPPSLAALAPMSVLQDMYQGIGFPGGIFNNGFAQNWLEGRESDAEPAPGGGQAWATTLIEQGDTRCKDNQKLRLQTIDALELLDRTPYREPLLYEFRTPVDWAKKIDVPVFLVGGMQDEQLGSDWMNVIEALDGNPDVWVTIYNGNHNDALGPEIFTRWAEFLYLFVGDEVPKLPEQGLSVGGLVGSQIGSAAAPAPSQSELADEPSVEAARKKFEETPRITILMEVGGGELGPRSLQSTSQLTFDEWPPKGTTAQPWLLADGGVLVPEGTKVPQGTVSYLSDPAARPVQSAENGGVVYSKDQDYTWVPVVDGKGLGFSTAPLAEDLLVMGNSSLDLTVATTGTDADLQATLTEVRPDGTETYLTSGWLRASHRKLDTSASTATRAVQTHLPKDGAPLVAGTPVKVRIPINPVAAWVRAGSRLRVTLLAPGGDVPEWNVKTTETGRDTVTVTLGGAAPSQLSLGVLPKVPAPTPLPGCNTLRGQPCRLFVPAANGG